MSSPTAEKDLVKLRYKREDTFYNKHIEPVNLDSKYSSYTVNDMGGKKHRGFQSNGSPTTSNDLETVYTIKGSTNINNQFNLKKLASENT